MKLGEWIKEYRKEHGISMQVMADMCGFSKAYVGMLEKGINPTTKRPISPTMQTFQKIADGVGIDVNELIKVLDSDQPVTVAPYSAPSPDNTVQNKNIDSKDIINTLHQDGVMLDGRPLSPDEAERLLESIQLAIRQAKKTQGNND